MRIKKNKLIVLILILLSKVGLYAQIVIDIDSNVYNTVTLGTQIWMKENLKVTKYNDGAAIPLVNDNSVWFHTITPAYCWYNYNHSTLNALYNWYTVNTHKLCPIGWHVPTDIEWTILTNYLGGDSIAGGKLKEIDTIHWIHINIGASNETGFTALPYGYCRPDETFGGIGYYGFWWSATEDGSDYAFDRDMHFDNSNIDINNHSKRYGFSVRCVKD